MTTSRPRRPRLRVLGLGLGLAIAVPALAPLPAISGVTTAPAAPSSPDDVRTLGDSPHGLSDLDLRDSVDRTAGQVDAARRAGFRVSWNTFGTAGSVSPARGADLGDAPGDAVAGATAWLSEHRDVLGINEEVVDGLELVNAQKLRQSSGRAVLFRQTFGEDGFGSARGGLVTVAVKDGRVHYVSSSLVKAEPGALDDTADLSPVEGWLAAADEVGLPVSAGDVVNDVVDDVSDAVGAAAPWTRLTVDGLAQEQQARPTALALADGTVRPVVEANVVDAVPTDDRASLAYTSLVDAVTGEVLFRENQVEHAVGAAPVATTTQTLPFQGSITPTACDDPYPVPLTDDATRSIVVGVTAAIPTNDVTVKLFDPNGDLLVSQDLLTSPEALTYSPDDPIPAGEYSVQVCPFDAASVMEPGTYAGVVQTSDEGLPGGGGGGNPSDQLPRYRFFPANPELDFSADTTPTNDRVACWGGRRGLGDKPKGCTLESGPVDQPFSAPWDIIPGVNVPSFTSLGNNANTAEAWASPLTPGGLMQRPFSPERRYTTPRFTDAWNNARCNPAQLVPGGNDVVYATTNLNVQHNRMHDYGYGLGFTEQNYNMQVSNFGKNPDASRERDPEVGNVQAGALSGAPVLTGLGRDNANQITLQDGIPGITNQYLFQPIAGAFYSPCVDGALDFSIAGHEYTHAISNRMIAGPDEGLTSEQGGAMGESWSDLVASEYIFSHGYDQGADPFVTGAYATGNKVTGIRNYATNKNPLNYSNYGYDTTGAEVHADGEIWNGTMWEVRQALVEKWERDYPYRDAKRQLSCAQGRAAASPLRPQVCAGNRRWVQLMFDSFLLQASGSVSMLDMRDAFLAADRVRFNGANQKVIWDAFARRGMGEDAVSRGGDDTTVVGGFASPRSDNGRITFDTAGAGNVYVGQFEARSRPVADTRRGTELGDTATLVPGTYEMLYVSPTRGAKRFSLTVKPGERRTVSVAAPENLAAAANGAKVTTSTAGSLNADDLIDGTEATNWAGRSSGTGVPVDQGTSPSVTVDLAGGVRTVRRVQVSAMLRPAAAEGEDDTDAGSRFTSLRRFALEACVSQCGSPDATFRRFYTSPADAFPSVRPRPTIGTQQLRSFTVPATKAQALRFVALENQCTGFGGYAGEQDDDPTNDTDCTSATDRDESVRAAELQVY
ncbi:M36 family metallopeptidase [uncultured Nocardioides sp.]|uniref:M36 family metallopeptidase n=1 Tax=uncultured Nocardioides sp. TaxID=198441 RepID=UPI00262C40A7|nr:M36 family metallopeptidase [uncultured Nocardioides sp.]